MKTLLLIISFASLLISAAGGIYLPRGHVLSKAQNFPKTVKKAVVRNIVEDTMTTSIINFNDLSEKKTTTEEFIEKYKSTVLYESKIYNLNAACLMAQLIHESSSGNSKLAIRSNNLLGLKRPNGSNLPFVLANDDAPNEKFIKFNTPEASIRYRNALIQKERYRGLYKIPKNDYVGWCKELKRAGYASDILYEKKLVNIIQKYKLYELDY